MRTTPDLAVAMGSASMSSPGRTIVTSINPLIDRLNISSSMAFKWAAFFFAKMVVRVSSFRLKHGANGENGP